VTTVISAGLPKPALMPWAAKMAAEYAVENWDELATLDETTRLGRIKTAHSRYTSHAGDIGDEVHSIIEAAQLGKPFPAWSSESDPFVTKFIDFMMDIKPHFIESEVTLWSREYGYAGTADWIAEIDGKVIYGDNKTGKRTYPEVGMQLSALGHADFILRPDGTEEVAPEPDGYAALHIRPSGWSLKHINESEACFHAFLACKEILKWSRLVAPKVLRKPREAV
jgi:hypothetical protein